MNNKSTENLISSDGSIEALSVPPLKTEKNIKTMSISDQSTDGQRNYITNLVMDKVVRHVNDGNILPIPAVRKSILQPIAVKQSDKELKNDQNHLRKKMEQNEGITEVEVINKYENIFVDERTNFKSNSDTKYTSSRVNQIALSSLDKQKNGQIKKRLVKSKANAITTFISHEEKSENEDLSERSYLNRSAEELNMKKSSSEHLLDMNDSSLQRRKPQKTSSKMTKIEKSKSKNKKLNIARKQISKKQQSSNKEKEAYDGKNLISIWLHETSALKFNRFIRRPRICISIYDLNEGNLLSKSNPLRNAVPNNEPTNNTLIQPILSSQCRFKDKSWIECDWSDDLLIIDVDIRHIKNIRHIVIFFEIFDDIISDLRDPNDWNGCYSINWAFLKLGDGKTYSNFDKKSTLQLYYYQKRKNNDSILDEWKTAKKKKYPGSLSVTVGSYKPELKRSASPIRPMIQRSDDEELFTIHGNQDEEVDVKTQTTSKELIVASHLESRLPGQLCECPNRVMYRHEIRGEKRHFGSQEQYGSMIAEFSKSGHLLAFHCTAYHRHNHQISILNVINLKIINTLTGHLNIVYDLEWLNENVLVSVSSDRTAIVWFIFDRGEFMLKILPHPSFVYTVKWLHTPHDYVFIATGGRDCILRIWKMSLENKDDDIELCSELIQHEDYITSLLTNRKSSRLYTADWAGVLLEWSRSKSKSKRRSNSSKLFQLRRQMKVFSTSIIRIELHPKSNRIFAQCLNDPLIYVIDITPAIVIQTIETARYTRRFTISPCGTFIFTNGTNDDQIKCIRIWDAKENTHFRLPISLNTRKYLITSLAFHPTKNIIACTVFGTSLYFGLYIMYHDNGNIHEKSIADNLRIDLHSINQWNGLRSKESAIFGSKALEAILHQIDDLFCIAIQTPKHFADYEYLKQMHVNLEKLQQIQQPLSSLNMDENVSTIVSKNFLEHSNGPIKNFEGKHLPDIDNTDMQSTSSHQTFTLETRPQQAETYFKFKNEANSINSECSNLTFDVHK